MPKVQNLGGHFGDVPSRDDPVRIVVESPTHLRAYRRTAGEPGLDDLLAIARAHRDGSGRWSVVIRGGTERLTFDNELSVRVFMAGLLDDVDDQGEAGSGPGGRPAGR